MRNIVFVSTLGALLLASLDASAQSAPAEPKAGKAPAASPVLKTTGSFVTRYELREGYRGIGRSRGRFQEGDASVYRARLGFRTAPIETGGPQVILQFTPQASGWLGQTSTIVDYDLGLHEGYLRLQDPEGAYRLDVGRFEMNYGDALVIGNLGWHQTARAFEGLRARFSLGKGWVDTFVTQVGEGRVLSDPYGAGDTYFYGVYAGLGEKVAKGLALDVYALGQTSPGATGVPDNPVAPTGLAETVAAATEVTLGARVKQKSGSVDYRLEAGLQFGSRANTPTSETFAQVAVVREAITVFAYQVDGELGFTPSPGLRASVGGLLASGDDPTTAKNEGWNQLYPTAHKFLGLADVFGGRSNAASANASLSYKAGPKLILKAQGHALWRLKTAGGTAKYTGTELDTHAIVPLGKGLKVRAMYGLFISKKTGSFAPIGEASNLAHYLEVSLSYALK